MDKLLNNGIKISHQITNEYLVEIVFGEFENNTARVFVLERSQYEANKEEIIAELNELDTSEETECVDILMCDVFNDLCINFLRYDNIG